MPFLRLQVFKMCTIEIQILYQHSSQKAPKHILRLAEWVGG